jgi:drug/metabolite transporter (DMT)-like permease
MFRSALDDHVGPPAGSRPALADDPLPLVAPLASLDPPSSPPPSGVAIPSPSEQSTAGDDNYNNNNSGPHHRQEKEEEEEEEEEEEDSFTFHASPHRHLAEHHGDDGDGDDLEAPDQRGAMTTPPNTTNCQWFPLGVLYLLMSGLIFAFMAMLVSIIIDIIPASELILFRGIAQASVMFFVVKYVDKYPLLGEPGQRVWLALRGFFGVSSLLCYYISIEYLPLSDAAFVNATTPIWAGILAHLFLGEAYTYKEMIYALVSFIGILFIAHPASVFGLQAASDQPPHIFFGMSFGLLAAVLAAAVYVLIRKLGVAAPSSAQVFHWGLAAIILYPLFKLVTGDAFVLPWGWPLVCGIGVGVSSLATQYFFNKGAQLESAAIASVLRNSSAVFSLLFQLLFLGIPPGFFYSFIGGLLILAVIVLSGYDSYLSRPPPASNSPSPSSSEHH